MKYQIIYSKTCRVLINPAERFLDGIAVKLANEVRFCTTVFVQQGVTWIGDHSVAISRPIISHIFQFRTPFSKGSTFIQYLYLDYLNSFIFVLNFQLFSGKSCLNALAELLNAVKVIKKLLLRIKYFSTFVGRSEEVGGVRGGGFILLAKRWEVEVVPFFGQGGGSKNDHLPILAQYYIFRGLGTQYHHSV